MTQPSKVTKNISSKSFGTLTRNLPKPAAALRHTQSYKAVKTTASTNNAKTVPVRKPLTSKKVSPNGQKTLQSNSGDKLTNVIKTNKAQVSSTFSKQVFKTSNKYKNIQASSSVVAYKKDLQKSQSHLHSKSHGAIGVGKTKKQKNHSSKSVGSIPTKHPLELNGKCNKSITGAGKSTKLVSFNLNQCSALNKTTKGLPTSKGAKAMTNQPQTTGKVNKSVRHVASIKSVATENTKKHLGLEAGNFSFIDLT